MYEIYELMIKTNQHLISGGFLTDAQKAYIVKRFLNEQTPINITRWGNMYPKFFIPFEREKKYQTVIPMSPKTQILSQNAYELEIIRLLYLFAEENSEVKIIVNKTLERLKQTCFGYKSCYTGECFESGIIVLRFLASVAPHEISWIKKQIKLFNQHYANKRRHSGVLKYFWLCLSELPIEIAKPEILRYKDLVLSQNKSKNDDHILNAKINDKVLSRVS